jgi:hypothetical protein
VEGGGFEPPKLARQIYSLIPLATREPLRKGAYSRDVNCPCQRLAIDKFTTSESPAGGRRPGRGQTVPDGTVNFPLQCPPHSRSYCHHHSDPPGIPIYSRLDLINAGAMDGEAEPRVADAAAVFHNDHTKLLDLVARKMISASAWRPVSYLLRYPRMSSYRSPTPLAQTPLSGAPA